MVFQVLGSITVLQPADYVSKRLSLSEPLTIGFRLCFGREGRQKGSCAGQRRRQGYSRLPV